MFANHILLSEGESDPIYIHALIQRMNKLNYCNLDLNNFSAISTNESKNTDTLIRMLTQCQRPPNLGVLVDGDQGGKARLKSIKELLDQHSIEGKQLAQNTAIEDHLPFLEAVFVPAVANYVHKMLCFRGKKPDALPEFESAFLASFNEKFKGKSTYQLAEWVNEVASDNGFPDQPSKVGIAREYADILLNADDKKLKKSDARRAIKLVELIQELSSCPEIKSPESKILS